MLSILIYRLPVQGFTLEIMDDETRASARP